ncbi:MAG TPA: aldolase/citrate lyase family protein [Ramlibacter sp.]|nr:aldolase/citrate lyase family protein [Ramlibacter sp.]
MHTSLRDRLHAREPLLGTFIKTPGAHAIEILGEVGLDFVVIDAEHAPWDRASIDMGLLAAKSQSLPALVRVAAVGDILNALDGGAAGVMVPHVADAASARAAAAAARYRGGSRGFSNSPRAGRYGGLGLAAHLDAGDRQATVIAMLEDPAAVDNVDELVEVEGIDAFFLGRGDLTVALGETSADSEVVRRAVERLSAAVVRAGKPLCAFIARTAEIAALRPLGVSTFILSSDQGLLRQAAAAEWSAFKTCVQ